MNGILRITSKERIHTMDHNNTDNVYIHGDLDDTIMSKELSVTLNSKIDSSRGWKHNPITITELFECLSYHRVGHKNGPCFLSAKLIGDQRKTNAVESIFSLTLDFDAGLPMDELIDLIVTENLLGALHTTHSNGETETQISDNVLRKEYSDEYTDKHVMEYLRDVKGYHSSVLKDVTIDKATHTENGIVVTVHHNAITKCRLVLPLKEPFVFAERSGSHKDAILEWKARYLAFANTLNLKIDKSCTDPARAFFLPSRRKGSEYATHLIAGALLDLDSVKINANYAGNANRNATNADTKAYQTPWLKRFLAKHAREFDSEQFFATYCEERNERSNGSGAHYQCPNDDQHSNAGDTEDNGFYSISAQNNDRTGSFHAQCMHDACSHLDRGDFLDLVIQANDIVYEDLLEFCDDESYSSLDEMLNPENLISTEANTKTGLPLELPNKHRLPSGYFYEDHGIWIKNGEKKAFVCGEFHFEGIARDPDGSGFSLIIKIGDAS